MNTRIEAMTEDWQRPTTKWVKGELLDTLDPAAVDPREMLRDDATLPPFDRLAWFDRVARHWDGDCHPLVAHAWTEGNHAWMFLAEAGRGEMRSLSNWYSFAFRPVFSGGASGQLLLAIAKRLRASRAVAPVLTLAPVPRADGSSDMVMKAFGRAGWIAHRTETSTSWTADVAGLTFKDYWAARPGELRSTFQRKTKKSGFKTNIINIFDEEIWSAYEDVYHRSWKAGEVDTPFLREMAEAEGRQGNLRLGIATLDDRPVAAQLWVVSGGTAYIHKLAYDAEVRDLSPGTVLSHDIFAHVIDKDKVSRIDYGTGDDGHKAAWMDGSHALDTIRLYKPNAISGLAGAARERLSALVRGQRLD